MTGKRVFNVFGCYTVHPVFVTIIIVDDERLVIFEEAVFSLNNPNIKRSNLMKLGDLVFISSKVEREFKSSADFYIVVDKKTPKLCCLIPCWQSKKKNMLRIFAVPNTTSVDAREVFFVKEKELSLYNKYRLKNVEQALSIISNKHIELEKRKNKKKNKAKKTQGISIHAQQYELAVINNDQKLIKAIEKQCGGDPRPKKDGLKTRSLKYVSNAKPCRGGHMMPK